MTNKKDDDDGVVIPSRVQIWKLASRPHTLTASIVPVIVGYALTIRLIHDNPEVALSKVLPYSTSSLPPPPPLLLLSIQYAIFASFIQLSTNLHNDYADYIKGADTSARIGQARATQRGWLTPYETCRGCVLCLGVALFVGLYYLIPIPLECTYNNNNDGDELFDDKSDVTRERNYYTSSSSTYDPIMIFIVLSSMFNAVAYTGGPFPLGYIGLGHISIGYTGLGDIFVFVYFGIVATVGVPYLYLTKISCCLHYYSSSSSSGIIVLWQLMRPSFLHSIPVGLLATAIIVVNNLRDRHTDVYAGKRTLAVRYGETFARVEYLLLLFGSYTFCIITYFWEQQRDEHDDIMAWTALLPLASFPMAIPQLHAVAFGHKDGQALNNHVGGTARLQLVYCIFMATGLIISS